MKKDILSFLEQLAENNNKEWMETNRQWFLQVKSSLLEAVGKLLKGMVEMEPGLASLEPKDCIFRQNRDVRFSPNKSPYKTNMAAIISVGGKKSPGPGYYLHIQPGGSMVGGGIYSPNSEALKKIRQEIDYSGKELADILNGSGFKDLFGEIQGESLKTSPRGYKEDHPYINYLKMKSFIALRTLSDPEILSGVYIEKALESFMAMKPFTDFLSKAIEEVDSGEGLL